MISKQNYEEKIQVLNDVHIKGANFCTDLKLFETQFKADMFISKSYFQNMILA